jgi:asparagine synthase (glutamine-hydrolysing)
MCGIAGAVWTSPKRAIGSELLQRMTDAIVHRGPDDEGFFRSEMHHRPGQADHPGVALGFRRLSIIDLSGGHQPLGNEDGTIQIIFNGEIYNYRDLRRRLEGASHHFRTDSDTETIVHLYEDLGLECFDHLNGMFAIAIWDGRKEQLVLARDRLGKKPLYYALQEGRLSFASELKSLVLVPDLPKTIDPAALDRYLTYQYIPHPYSIYREIAKLPPGHCGVYRRGAWSSRSFWSVDWSQERPIQRNEAIDRLKFLLTDSVKLRLRSDVPLGAFLSGGIDSSLMVALAQQQSSQPIKTFSIGFPVKDYDETHYAQMVADHVGTDHQRLEVSPDALSVLDQLVYAYDEPFSDSSAVPTWYLSQWTRQHVTVAISGDGGDELFAGYERYQALLWSDWVGHWFPGASVLRSDWFARLPHSQRRRSWLRRLKRFGESLGQTPERRYMNWIQIFGEALRWNLYRDDFIAALPDRDPVEFLSQAWRRVGKRDLMTQASLGDLQTYLPCDLMTKVDIASMAHSLEVRQPMLDYRLVEWAASLPIGLKYHQRRGKRLLRDAFGSLLPEAIWTRPKMGFGIPIQHWFRGPLRDRTVQTLLADDARCLTYFQREPLEEIVQSHMQGRRDEGYRLWNLLFLELWLRKWVP